LYSRSLHDALPICYKVENNKLPENDDWETLEKIGFKTEMLGTSPSYETDGNDEYEIIFLEGFDGPYLMWNSKEGKWKIGFPTIFFKNNKIGRASCRKECRMRCSQYN